MKQAPEPLQEPGDGAAPSESFPVSPVIVKDSLAQIAQIDLSVSNSSSGRRWKLDHAPAVGDPTHMVEFGTGRRAFAREA